MISRDGALTSLWQATTSRAPESYNGNRIAAADKFFDVIIVGGGITGVSTAILLRQAGFKCAILEAHTLCFGTTGGTTAHLNTILDTPYPAMIKNFDRQTAQTVADATRAAIGLIRSNIEKFDIACGFQKTTGYLFSQTDEQTKELEEIYETSRGLGIELGYTDSIPVDIKMIKALAIQDQARFHPTRYVQGLAEAFQIMDGRIIEQCRVTGVENNDPVTVHTSGGDIQCTYLIYATHIPPGMNILDTRCAPYRSYAIAATLKGGYPEGLIYDMYDPYHYYRTQTIDDQPYLIVGGEDHKTGHGDNITLALYKDERGELHAIAPTCTHMGCHVTWNNMEKSWDCPCHGARYSPDGAVLTGPADRSLEIIDIQSLVEGGCI